MSHPLRRILRPHGHVADALQHAFSLPRPPLCRMQRSRFEIVVRGAGLSREPIDRCIAIADAMTDAARPLLAASHLRVARRAAAFAIRVTFEDEEIVAGGVATTRISYVAAMHDVAAPQRLPRARGVG